MTEEQITDKMAQIIRVGFVNARQPEKMRVKVTLKDTVTNELVTDWLPVLCPRACKDAQYDLPDVGDQVLCLFLPYGLEQGFVVGAMYGANSPPVSSGDKWHRKFSDGATLEYDRASHELTADIPGKVTAKAAESYTIESPIVYIKGKLVNTDKDGSPGKAVISGGLEVQNGGVNVPDADVSASGVSLTSHKTEGVQAGNDTSSHPAGGSAESKGTGTILAASMSAAALAASIAAKLLSLEEDVSRLGSDIDKLIMCMPQIAEALADRDTNDLDKKGYKYLKKFFDKWLAGRPNPNADSASDVEWVDFKWLIAFVRSYRVYFDLIQPEYLFTKNSMALLVQRLKDNGKFTDHEENFNFIDTDPHKWQELYFQSKGVGSQKKPDFNISSEEINLKADGLMAAMGSFMLYALAKGKVIPHGENNGSKVYKIVVDEVGIVGFDRFNFNGEQSYRYWRCSPPGWSYGEEKGYLELTNNDFRAFRTEFGRGYDFLVVSGPEMLARRKEFLYEYKL